MSTTGSQTRSVADDLLSLVGKTALVTAAGSGMGRAGAKLFAARGAHVIVIDRYAERTKETVAEIVRDGGSAEAHVADLGDQAALNGLIDAILSTHDVLDVLYNHVGITGPRDLDFDYDEWARTFAINAWVGTAMTQRFLPLLRKSKAASIIFTSSTAGLTGVAGLPTYAATKGAVIQFMKAVAVMLAPEGIRANAICPGGTDTEGMRAAFQDGVIDHGLAALAKTIPLGRVAQPEDMSPVALFLASDASRYVTGAVFPVDGAATTGTFRTG